VSTETHEQKEWFSWFSEEYPEFIKCVRVSQSGAHRGKGKNAAIRIAKAKGQGEIPGEADIALLLPRGGYGSLLIEHKGLGQGHSVSDDQAEYLEHHNKAEIGNLAVSTRGLEALKEITSWYISL
jgi:hypothetical protein